MSGELGLEEIKGEWHGNLKAYAIGFMASIFLTAASFLLVVMHPFSKTITVCSVIFLAVAQAIVQLVFFLHVGQEARPRWETTALIFMVVILLIIALGTLWIMYDLDERMMSGMMMEMQHD